MRSFVPTLGSRAGWVLLVSFLCSGACGDGDAGGRPTPSPNGTAARGAIGGTGAGGSTSPIPNGQAGFTGGGRGGSSAMGMAGRRGNDCANAMVNTSASTPDILFVIDGSGSMCAGFGGGTRWQALRTALLEPANGLIYKLQTSAVFGMVLYDGTIDLFLALSALGSSNPECALPYTAMKAEGMCPGFVEVPMALNNAMAIDMAFPQTELGGSTPTDRAMNHAVELLLGMRSADPDAQQNPQYIILATDGQPNDICVGGVGGDNTPQKQGVIAAVDRAQMNKITTFVISLAGNDAQLTQHLEEVADHGDPANPMAHAFSPMTPEDLVNTLSALLGGAIGCNITLDAMVTPGLECRGTVEMNGTKLPCCMEKMGAWTCNEMPAAMPDGWRLKDPSTVELMGATCTNFLNSPQASLRAAFPCNVFVE